MLPTQLFVLYLFRIVYFLLGFGSKLVQERLLHSPPIALKQLCLTSSFKNVLFIFYWARTLCIGSGLSCPPNSDCLLCFSLPGTLWLDNAADGREIFICWLLSGISWLTNYDGSQNTCTPLDSAERQIVCSFVYLFVTKREESLVAAWVGWPKLASVSCESRSEYTPHLRQVHFIHFLLLQNNKTVLKTLIDIFSLFKTRRAIQPLGVFYLNNDLFTSSNGKWLAQLTGHMTLSRIMRFMWTHLIQPLPRRPLPQLWKSLL